MGSMKSTCDETKKKKRWHRGRKSRCVWFHNFRNFTKLKVINNDNASLNWKVLIWFKSQEVWGKHPRTVSEETWLWWGKEWGRHDEWRQSLSWTFSGGAKIPGPYIFLAFSPSPRVKLFVQKVIGSMTLTSQQKEDPLLCVYKYLQYVNCSEFISFWRTHYSNLSQNKSKSEKEICTNKWLPFQSHLYPVP